MDIILIGGLWLRAEAWNETARALTELGHHPTVVRLPGADDDTAATLDDQLAAVLAAVDAADRPLVVGHSAASTLAWLAADRRADAVHAVALVGGMPAADGTAYAAFFDIVDGGMPFPGWEPFPGPNIADLSEQQLAELASGRPVPEGVATATVTYTDARRHDVPVVMVCPEYSPDDAREWMAGGHIPELTPATHLSYADIDSGHWPMVSVPGALARVIDSLTS